MSTSSPETPVRSVVPLPIYATTSSSRLHALYSDIARQKHSNPTSYHANVEWWRNSLEQIVSLGLQGDSPNRLVLRAGRALMERLRVEGVGKPLALDAVLTELQTSNAFISYTDFLNSRKSIYDAGWLPARIAAYVVGKPLWWAMEQLGIVGEDGLLGGSASRDHKDTRWWGEYVIVSLVEKAAEAVLEKQRSRAGGPSDRLYSVDAFKKAFGSVVGRETLADGDAKVILRFLERDKRALIVEKEIVKFITDDETSLHEISAVDRGILELKTAVENLRGQIDGLHQKMDECTRTASEALKQSHKSLALSYLRSRKLLDTLLHKRLDSLSTLESTMIGVETAAGDVEIMKTYETSTATLRAILAHPSLQRESIDATMDALAEANSDAKEIDDAVRLGGDLAVGASETVDEGELEDELNALIAEEEKEVTRRKLEKEEIQVPSAEPVKEKEHTIAIPA